MAVVYRTPGPWGGGLGTNLTAAQVDNNFWELVSRLVTLETRTPATATLTLTGNALNNQTVTIGTRVYTWKTTLTGAANEVKIGASASASLDNLIAAINNGAGEGTVYGTGTIVHSLVVAVAGTGDTMDITARVAGENGNTIVTAETMTLGSWGDTTMTGGVGIGPDNIESISVIGSQMTIFMQSGDTFGPFTLPIAMIRWRGDWAPATDYAELDLVMLPSTESFPGVYLVLKAHLSESIFDPSQIIDGDPVYQKLFAISGVGPLNFRGAFEVTNYAVNDMFVGPETSYVVLIDHVSEEPFDPNRLIGGFPVYMALIPPIPPTEEPTSNIWDPVELATSGNVALTGEQTIDGVMSAATPVLVRDNTDKTENGIWVTAAGAWARRTDANDAAEFEYAKQVLVMNGTTFAGSIFYLNTAAPYVIGTTELVFNELAAPDRAVFIQIETAANVTLKRKRHSRRAVRMNRPTVQNFNMDNTDGFGAGRGFNLEQIGAGAVTVVPSGGVTIERPSGMSLTLVRYAVYGFFKIDATTWRMSGGIVAASGIPNDSGVTGASIADALDTLDAAIGGGGYTDEMAQDAVGSILVDGTTINFTYNDPGPSITAEVTAVVVRYDITGTFAAGQLGTASHPTDPTNAGTFKPTLDATHFNLQWFNNNVAGFTFAAPDLAGDYTIIVDMINGASAGTVSYSGWTKNPSGDALTTTNGHKFRFFITKLNGNVSADIKALQ